MHSIHSGRFQTFKSSGVLRVRRLKGYEFQGFGHLRVRVFKGGEF